MMIFIFAILSFCLCASNVNWMERHASAINNVSLNRIMLPASHDSGTDELEHRVGPDAPSWLANAMNFILKYFPSVDLYQYIDGWAKTETMNITEQLTHGIRFFDVRAVYDAQTDTVRVSHLLLSKHLLSTILQQVADFLRERARREVVVLYLSNFHDFNDARHERLIQELANIFGDLLVPQQTHFPTYDALVRANQRVLVLYRSHTAFGHPHTVWDYTRFDFSYADSVSLDDMLAVNVKALRSDTAGDERVMFWPTWVLTENERTIVLGVLDPQNNVHTNRELSQRVSRVMTGGVLGNDTVRRTSFTALFADQVREAATVALAKQRNLERCHDVDARAACRQRCPLDQTPPSVHNATALQRRCARTCALCPALGAALGERCEKNDDCLSRQCERNLCVDDVLEPSGTPCGFDFQCASLACVDWQCR